VSGPAWSPTPANFEVEASCVVVLDFFLGASSFCEKKLREAWSSSVRLESELDGFS